MTSIGRRCTGGDALSRALLIARTLRLPCRILFSLSSFASFPRLHGFHALSCHAVIQAAIARRLHLFPSRTEQLSSAAPMVLRQRESRSPPSWGPPSVPHSAEGGGTPPFYAAPRGGSPFVSPFLSPPTEGARVDSARRGGWFSRTSSEGERLPTM